MKKIFGVTIIELLIVLVIIAILTIVAMMLYSSSVRNGRRSDAINVVFSISLAEEQYRSSNTTYGTIAQVWNNVTTSPGGFYTLAISNVAATTYTITATAAGDQTNDLAGSTSCSTLTLAMSAGTITKTPAACWPQ